MMDDGGLAEDPDSYPVRAHNLAPYCNLDSVFS